MNEDIDIKDMVVFHDIGSKKSFFTCHPAEARIAMDAVREQRKLGVSPIDRIALVRRYIELGPERASEITDVKDRTVTAIGNYLSITSLNEAFVTLQQLDNKVDLIITSARSLADLRNWGVDIQTYSSAFMKSHGIITNIWGADVVLDNRVASDIVHLLSFQKEGLCGSKALEEPVGARVAIVPDTRDKWKSG
jgi:hypothetical protein